MAYCRNFVLYINSMPCWHYHWLSNDIVAATMMTPSVLVATLSFVVRDFVLLICSVVVLHLAWLEDESNHNNGTMGIYSTEDLSNDHCNGNKAATLDPKP